MHLPFTNIRQVLSLHGKVSPEKIFLTVVGERGREELSYGEFSARSHQTANFLQEDLRIQPGDTVAILDGEALDTVVLLMACWLIGAVTVPLAGSPADVVVEQLKRSGAKVALIRDRYLPDWQFYMRDEPPAELRDFWQSLTIIQLGGEPQETYQHFHTLVRSMPNTFFNEHPEPTLDYPAALFTHAHDALLMPMTQGELLNAAQLLANEQAITGNQRLSSSLPLRSEDAINVLLATLVVGGSLFQSGDSDINPQAFWREVAASRLHIACLSEWHIRQLMEFAHEQQASGKPIYGAGVYQQDITQLRHIYCPDVALTPELRHSFTALFPFPVVTNG